MMMTELADRIWNCWMLSRNAYDCFSILLDCFAQWYTLQIGLYDMKNDKSAPGYVL